MSMPKFPEQETILSKDEALNAILTSIAMEETALSHILNAEGEKIQCAVKLMEQKKCCNGYIDMSEILRVNESVASLLEQITDLQIILKNKFRLAARLLPPIILKNKFRLAARLLPPEKRKPYGPEKPCSPKPPDKPCSCGKSVCEKKCQCPPCTCGKCPV